ncbi:hypothetical protein PYW07_013019 [Mythimna separata]|uniref:Uncharacterized protein n=1 Tax=Mythimna separata TaxID=271217 RepID=A0AAD7Y5K0_MYTSE|nr:hypothetical protein PYW07_013019 [Mythimna separata]
MDDTQHSRVSDAAAAANRKRRSSILKSQRPARTPFSELEFNVATPTDTAKSRRVSFSKRTGVAEFVTNEATTTWKNFYEEHNKSLESSSNESEANASRQPVGHLGKRIFDQQFQEVEAVDFMSGLTNGSLNVNFSQQPISLECTEGKLTAPNNKFELSAFTEQSKLFGNDFTAPTLGEGSGRIDVNFSAIQQIEKDDLDEFEKDLQRGPNNMGCLGPFSDRQNMCEYIEVDLNMTHVAKNEEDMSITDTVHSPVQDVSKSASIDKKAILNSDWVADKENIVVNPYAAPVETNFAVNEEPDQVLVFDGKRLTLQPDVPDKEKNYRQTLLPNSSAETPTRKTIVLNTNDDLPNYLGDMRNSKCENSFYNGFQEIKSNEDEISDTVQLSRAFNKPKRQTIHDITGNISITQALPTNIICQTAVISQDGNPSERKSIVFEKSANDISMTEPVPVKLLSSGGSLAERCHTVVYEDDTANISMTQAVPTNILVNETPEDPKKEIFKSDEALSSNTLDQKPSTRKTIVFDDDNTCNVSFTQAVPSNILLADKLSKEKRQTIIYENDTGNISVTQALPTNVILANSEPNSARRQTIVYSDDTGNISVTQALPSNILLEKRKLDVDNEAEFIPTSQPLLNTTAKNCNAVRRRTIVYENDTGNLSITQAIPAQLIPGYSQEKPIDTLNTSPETSPTNAGKKPRNRQRQTIAYDNDDGDISMTEAISAKILEEVKSEGKTIVFDETEANISATLAVSTNVFLLDQVDTDVDRGEIKEKVTDYDVYDEVRNSPVEAVQDGRKSNVFYPDMNCDMSLTTAISKVASLRETEKGDMSITKPIPAELITVDTELSSKVKDKLLDLTEPDQVVGRQSGVIVLQNSRANSRPTLQMSISEVAELKKIGAIYNDTFKDPSEDTTAVESFVADDVMIASSLRDVSANASVLHPRVEEKTNKLSLISTDMKEDKVSDGEDDAIMQTDVEEKQESLVNSEASMSVTTIGSGTDDKNVMVCIASSHSPSVKNTDGNTSPESLFYITNDEDDAATDTVEAKADKTQNVSYKQLPMHHLDEHLEAVDELQKKLALLESNSLQNRSQRYFDEVTSAHSKQVDEVDEEEDDKVEQQSHSYKSANDTQELLNMLTNLTDNLDSDNDIAPVVKVKDSEVTEHRRLSFLPSRQSIVLSREDLLNNISMAQAALQKSRLELDDIDSLEDDTKDATVDIADKSGRASNDVVKTLHFHDDSTVSEESLTELTPLKKTAFGETSYMYEPKGKVIPTYLKDVSDGIKELMLDLVKPVNNENLPFEIGIDKDLPATGSTQSTQIQTNLVASSQVDIASEAYSVSESRSDLPFMSQSQRPVTFSENMSELDDPDSKEDSVCTHTPVEEQAPAAPVLIFDHTNPLNNVLLPPMDFTEPHRYNPIVRPVQNANLPFDDKGLDTNIKLVKPEETDQVSEGLHTSPPPNTQSIGVHYNYTNREEVSRDFEVQTVTMTKEKNKRTSILQNGPIKRTPPKQESNANTQRKASPDSSSPTGKKDPKPSARPSTPSVIASKLLSLDQSVDAVLKRSKDDEVNTTIAMQQNRVLLESSSSLTLVDDPVEGQTSPMLPGKEVTNQRIRFSKLQLVDIAEQAIEAENTPKLTEIFSQDHYSSESNGHISKGKKRIYSPIHKHKHQSQEEVTPKPLTKMQKISKSPKVQSKMPAQLSSTDDSEHNMEAESDDNIRSPKSRDKKSPKSKTKKPGQTVIVRQLISECISFDPSYQRAEEDKKLLSYLNPKTDNLAELSHSDGSFTSSNDMKSASDEMMDCQSPHQSTREAVPRQADWQPDLTADTSSSKCESDTSVNVVTKIDMLSFMGGHECRWESSTADAWSFLLLHGRLRLTACLAPRLDTTQPQQRGHTLVRDLTVEVVQHEHANPVASMCVAFACSTMRHVAARALRAACRARDVAPLLRRCAAVARIALRWGRAMHDAKLHLAYSIDSDGNLAMKVANVPLRAVWEVRMRIALVFDDAHAVPTPRATDVRVRAVVSGVNVDADVARALAHTPKDWGHAPRIIWKVFRLLKHKKREDYLLA